MDHHTPPETQSGTVERWGSDCIADALAERGIRHLAMNPGSSLRGLLDSIVNHGGNRQPELVLCLHEEHAVALAHGFAKITGTPMAVALHSNVGLMHASMAIYNAWCDRVPMLILGANGPIDAASRRPWIDWLHTARDPGALVRHYVKWDDQPASLPAAIESLARAWAITCNEPCGPVYVCLDVDLQEAPVPPDLRPVPQSHYLSYETPTAPTAQVAELARQLEGARRPVILMGRVSRDMDEWRQRIELAERFGAEVITDLRLPAAFPLAHPLHTAPPLRFMHPEGSQLLRDADVILALEWVDLAGTLRSAGVDVDRTAVHHCSLDQYIHNGWSMDHQALPVGARHVPSSVGHLVRALLNGSKPERVRSPSAPQSDRAPIRPWPASGRIDVSSLAAAVREATEGQSVCFTRLPLGWPAQMLRFDHPLDYMGSDGGAGVGSGPGMAIGMALALRNTDRLAVAVLGDGDFLMGVNAWWTASALKLPMLVIICNNGAYYNDVIHQQKVANMRGRPEESKWVGQTFTEPPIDLAAMARAQGAETLPKVEDCAELPRALEQALAAARGGRFCVLEVVMTAGWDADAEKMLVAQEKT